MNVTLCSVPTGEITDDSIRDLVEKKKTEGQTVGMHPKIAITSLNHWTTKNGFKACKFYDIDMLYPSDADVEKYFKENQTDVVGLSAVVSTSYLQVKRLAKIIKKVNKNTVIVCGGYLTAAANTILKKTEVDICVVGNGEIAWVGILKLIKEHLETGNNKLDIDKLLEIKGISILDDNKNLKFSGYGQTLPGCEMTFPDLEYLKSGLQGNDKAFNNYFSPFWKNDIFSMDNRSYEKGRKPMMMNMFTSKGCVARCTFCQRGSKGYNVFDLDKLEAYLKILINKHNVGFIYVDDENFGSNRKYSHQVAELFHKYNLLWSCLGVRCTNVVEEDIIHYKKNGCCGLKFGIESGSQTMLDIMEKKYTVSDIKKAVFMCFDRGLYSAPVGYMLGMPGESLKTCMDSGKMMAEISAKIGVSPGVIFGMIDPYYAIPLVGTPLYEYGRQLGLIGQNVDEEEKYLELVSDVASYKRYYINFNGSPMSEVIFWDILVFLEATRMYEKLIKNKIINKEWEKKLQLAMKVQGNNPMVKSKQRKIEVFGGTGEKEDATFSQYFITDFLKQHVVFNKTLTKLPRFILYPIVRYMLYFEFLMQKYFFKEKHNLHRVANKKVNSKIRIKYKDIDPSKTTQKDRSLRTIVAKKVMQLKRSEQEKTLTWLTGGP
tara:strand:+ start:127 stop:2097 length:1971 start_codon:yes stop_codon:yes gene_type:complete